MLMPTYYAQNYAGIIRAPLGTVTPPPIMNNFIISMRQCKMAVLLFGVKICEEHLPADHIRRLFHL